MILWRGKSGYRGRSDTAIQAILTGTRTPSRNPKTGPMAQLTLDLVKVTPIEAVKTGHNDAICGGCTRKRNIAPSDQKCYVNHFQAPESSHKAHHGHAVTPLTPVDIQAIRRNGIRFGAYGDPAFLPKQLVTRLCSVAKSAGWTGYTQRWSLKSSQWLKHIAMASVSTVAQARKAEAMGWRAFYVRPSGSPLPDGFTQCPAAKEAGHRTTCQRCNLCNGSGDQDRRRSISTEDHS